MTVNIHYLTVLHCAFIGRMSSQTLKVGWRQIFWISKSFIPLLLRLHDFKVSFTKGNLHKFDYVFGWKTMAFQLVKLLWNWRENGENWNYENWRENDENWSENFEKRNCWKIEKRLRKYLGSPGFRVANPDQFFWLDPVWASRLKNS